MIKAARATDLPFRAARRNQMIMMESPMHSHAEPTAGVTPMVKHIMTSTDKFAGARVDFAGIVWDADHVANDVFKIEMVGQPKLYGD
jgi:hypothetical protein